MQADTWILEDRPRRRRQHWTSVAFAVLALLAAACGDDGDGNGEEDSSSGSPPDAHPSTAEDEGRAHTTVQGLVAESSQHIADLYEDPTQMNDPASTLFERLVALYTSESMIPSQLEPDLQAYADAGYAQIAGPNGFYEDITTFDLTTLDDNKVRFQYCATTTAEITGADLDDPYFAQVRLGFGEARRIDETWLLHDMILPSEPQNRDPELLPSDECQRQGLDLLEERINLTDPSIDEMFADTGEESDQ